MQTAEKASSFHLQKESKRHTDKEAPTSVSPKTLYHILFRIGFYTLQHQFRLFSISAAFWAQSPNFLSGV